MFTVTTTEHTGEVTILRFTEGHDATNAFWLLRDQPHIRAVELRRHDAPETPIVDLRDYF